MTTWSAVIWTGVSSRCATWPATRGWRLSFEAPGANGIGLREYLVVHGLVTLTEGGAPELLHRLAQTYIGPGTVFPPMPDPPPGTIAHIRIVKITGAGDWAELRRTELRTGDRLNRRDQGSSLVVRTARTGRCPGSR